MADSRITKNLERFAQAVASHDGRLGLDVGEEILPGIRVEQIDVVSGNFRVLCDGDHDGENAAEAEARTTRAVGREVTA